MSPSELFALDWCFVKVVSGKVRQVFIIDRLKYWVIAERLIRREQKTNTFFSGGFLF